MVGLSEPESDALLSITIVGLSYSNGYDSLYRASQVKDARTRCLFLVPEPSNTVDPNAIQIHDGKRKLGYVAAAEAPALKSLFYRWLDADGFDNVIVCDIGWMSDFQRQQMRKTNTVKVTGIYRVHERLARKFAAKQTF